MDNKSSDKVPSSLPGLSHLHARRIQSSKQKVSDKSDDSRLSTEGGDCATSSSTVTKRSFVPNLNVMRSTPAATAEMNSEQTGRKGKSGIAGKDWGSKSKGRFKKEFVQTTGVFSEGVASQQMGGLSKSASTASDAASAAGSANEFLAESVDDLTLDNILTGNFVADLKNNKCPLSLVGNASNLGDLLNAKKYLEHIKNEEMSSADEKLYLFQFPSLAPFMWSKKTEEAAECTNEHSDTTTETSAESMSMKDDLSGGFVDGSFEILMDGSMRMRFSNGVDNDEETIILNCSAATEDNKLSFSLFHQDQIAQTIQFCGNLDNQLICTPLFADLLNENSKSSSDES